MQKCPLSKAISFLDKTADETRNIRNVPHQNKDYI
jgi:hypothetical protein